MQIAILKSIRKFSFICLIALFCPGGCGTKSLKKDRNNNRSNQTYVDPSIHKASNVQQYPVAPNSNNSNKNKAQIQNKENIHSDNNPYVDTDGNQNPDSTGMFDQMDKENKKKNIEKEIKNIFDKKEDIQGKIKCIKHKITYLKKIKEICNNHRGVFYKLRIRWRRKIRRYLKKAGFKRTEIDNIKSKKDVESQLEQAQKDLKENEKELEQAKEKQITLTNAYGRL